MARIETFLTLYVSDLDYSSLYPTIQRYMNVSRETLATAMFQIEGRDNSSVQDYFSRLVNMRENAVNLCSEFHGMPTYREMLRLVAAELKEDNLCAL